MVHLFDCWLGFTIDYLFDKKSSTFFHVRISQSSKVWVSDFSDTRVRVEGVDSTQVAEKSTQKAPTASGIRKVEKSSSFLLQTSRETRRCSGWAPSLKKNSKHQKPTKFHEPKPY
jgi:hypothetical protein